jgi:predicted RNA-binding protein (virulence factor B family)
MSKKDFKKAVGGLLKEKKITLKEDGIHAISPQ